jgi:hypothetical protein
MLSDFAGFLSQAPRLANVADQQVVKEHPQGFVSAIDSNGRTSWIADAHRDDAKRFVVHADEKLTAFVELESAIRACGELV